MQEAQQADDSFIALTQSRDRRARHTNMLRSRSRGSPSLETVPVSMRGGSDSALVVRAHTVELEKEKPLHSRSAHRGFETAQTVPSTKTATAAHRAPHALKAKDRTWAYHAIMDVVQRMQREHCLPIAVVM